MPDVLVRNLTPDAIEELRGAAKRSGRSLQAELKRILEEEAESRRKRREFIEMAEDLSRRIGPQTTDSTELIREDRDSDYGRDW